jgi:phosphoribosylformylglycinamidine cyclo-ligase
VSTRIDFCGTVVGLVRARRLIDGSRAAHGTSWSGPSAGIHANGFSLVRRIVGDDPSTPTCFSHRHGATFGDVRALRPRGRRALAHVTGGGIAGGLARVLPEGVGAVIDPASWGRPAVFGWLAGHGVPEDELRRVFNIGIGYCAVVPSDDVTAGDLVIGRLEAGVEGVEWSDA